MAEIALSPRGAFAGLLRAVRPPGGGEAPLAVAERTSLQLAALVARGGDRAGLAERFAACCGTALPVGPTRRVGGMVTALGTGPRSWLVLAEGEAPGFAARLAADLGPLAAVSDQSDGQAVLRITGHAVRTLLAKGLGIDLHPRAFGPDRVAVSVCAHIGVTIWQTDPAPIFELAVPRSYAGSFSHWLEESAAEFGCEIGPPA